MGLSRESSNLMKMSKWIFYVDIFDGKVTNILEAIFVAPLVLRHNWKTISLGGLKILMLSPIKFLWQHSIIDSDKHTKTFLNRHFCISMVIVETTSNP